VDDGLALGQAVADIVVSKAALEADNDQY
jgi:hypothetical protein